MRGALAAAARQHGDGLVGEGPEPLADGELARLCPRGAVERPKRVRGGDDETVGGGGMGTRPVGHVASAWSDNPHEARPRVRCRGWGYRCLHGFAIRGTRELARVRNVAADRVR